MRDVRALRLDPITRDKHGIVRAQTRPSKLADLLRGDNFPLGSTQYSWMQHPSLPRESAQIDPRRIPEGPVAHGLSRTSRWGPTRKNEEGTP